MRLRPLATLTALSLMAGACAQSGPPRAVLKQIDRILENAPGKAQPSKIVAVEAAFERMAVEDGQWTAFRAFAAPGAVIHLPSGPENASTFLAGRSDPDASVRWDTRGVWVSCDARLAISRGRLETAGGLVGTFVTVWQLQDDGQYRWVYDVGAPDDPQPAALPEDRATADVIVVEGLDVVQGHVADCVRSARPPGGERPEGPGRAWPPSGPPPEARPPETQSVEMPAPPQFSAPAGAQASQFASPDGTLRWQWVHGPDGARRVVANYLAEGQWRTAIDQPIPGRIAPPSD